jgi:cysteine desulfurase
MAAALRAATERRVDAARTVARLRDRLAGGLSSTIPGLKRTVATATNEGARTAPYSCHVCIDDVDQEELLLLLDDAGVCASAGAACASGALEPSHVLLAMGIEPVRARGALRLSLGYTTTEAEVDHVLHVMPKIVERLRG